MRVVRVHAGIARLAPVKRSFDIGHDGGGLDLQRLVLAHLMAVRAEQEARRRVIHGAVGIAHSLQVIEREHLVDLRGRASEKKPSRRVGELPNFSICRPEFR